MSSTQSTIDGETINILFYTGQNENHCVRACMRVDGGGRTR